jgi:hypothetical protein
MAGEPAAMAAIAQAAGSGAVDRHVIQKPDPAEASTSSLAASAA